MTVTATPQGLEVARLEAETKAKAAKHVANMLQRPDQLEKARSVNICKNTLYILRKK